MMISKTNSCKKQENRHTKITKRMNTHDQQDAPAGRFRRRLETGMYKTAVSQSKDLHVHTQIRSRCLAKANGGLLWFGSRQTKKSRRKESRTKTSGLQNYTQTALCVKCKDEIREKIPKICPLFLPRGCENRYHSLSILLELPYKLRSQKLVPACRVELQQVNFYALGLLDPFHSNVQTSFRKRPLRKRWRRRYCGRR